MTDEPNCETNESSRLEPGLSFLIGEMGRCFGSTSNLMDQLEQLDECLELCRPSEASELRFHSDRNILPITERIRVLRNRLQHAPARLRQVQLLATLFEVLQIQQEVLEEFRDRYSLLRLDQTHSGITSGKIRVASDPDGVHATVRQWVEEYRKKGVPKHRWATRICNELQLLNIERSRKTILKHIKQLEEELGVKF